MNLLSQHFSTSVEGETVTDIFITAKLKTSDFRRIDPILRFTSFRQNIIDKISVWMIRWVRCKVNSLDSQQTFNAANLANKWPLLSIWSRNFIQSTLCYCYSVPLLGITACLRRVQLLSFFQLYNCKFSPTFLLLVKGLSQLFLPGSRWKKN